MNKRQMLQNHSLLAMRLNGMARAINHQDKPTDEQKQAARSFEQQAMEHARKAQLFGDVFVTLHTA